MRRPSLDLADPARNLEESIGSPTVNSPDAELDLSMPPTEEDLEAYERHDEANDNTQGMFSPPPHIAARLHRYRQSQARRMDSSASSRRNSISSAHSRSSHGCSRQAGPQSKYVAQHLRRASIIEDRKARLADRAAHAEKVRLRAAVAKAAVRDTTASEERALAAAQAREQKLAQVAAAGAEEVKRAKAVAEAMKARREQNLQIMKQQMEDRHAEAERRRREELRNRSSTKPRGRGSSPGTSKKTSESPSGASDGSPDVPETKAKEPVRVTEAEAVASIQWWWRAQQRKEAVTEFQSLGLTIDGVRETSFETVVNLLAQEKVLIVTSKVLRICGLQEGDTGSVSDMAAVRNFLSAFMILGHPSQVLSNKDSQGGGEKEQELVGKAKDLLISFETILSRLSSHNRYTVPPALAGLLAESYAAFYNALIAWKARDSNALVEVMVKQFVELDAIWQTVQGSTDPAVTESYRDSIKDNQAMLMARIKKLAGPKVGREKILEAVRKDRKARAQKKAKSDTKPREANHTVETALGQLGIVAGEPAGTQSISPSGPSESQPHPVLKIGLRIEPYQILPDNRVLVHELSINPAFRLSEQQFIEPTSRTMQPMFDNMRSAMSQDQPEEYFTLYLQIIRYVREKLQSYLTPAGRTHSLIGEMFDTDVAEREFRTGSFSYEKFFSNLKVILPQLCAPVRDDDMRDLIENSFRQDDIVTRLEALIKMMALMSCDHTNSLLHLSAHELIREGPNYETTSFHQDLQAGRYDLSRAQDTFYAARNAMVAEAARRDPDGANHPKSRVTPARIYNKMLVDIFTQVTTPSLEKIPEMLRLDYHRVITFGGLSRRIITTAAILLQCKNLLKRDVRAPWKLEASRIMTVLEEGEKSVDPARRQVDSVMEGVMAALETGRTMPAATKAQLRGLVAKILAASMELASLPPGSEAGPSEPVLRLLLNRVRGHMLARVSAASASDKVKATSTAGEKLSSLGLAEFVDKIRDMVDEVAKVGEVDRMSHARWWEAVAKSVEARAAMEQKNTEAGGGGGGASASA